MRFSLGSILIFTSIIGVWLGLVMNHAQRRQTALDAMVEMGADVHYSHENLIFGKQPRLGTSLGRWLLGDAYYDRVDSIDFLGSIYYTPEISLAPLQHLPEVKSLHITDTICLSDFSFLKALTQLNLLAAGNTKLDDRALRHLANASHLECLTIENTRVTDVGIAHLSGLTNLREVNLRGTRVTDQVMETLQHMPNLRALTLDDTKATGKGLASLTCQATLEQLSLRNTSATTASVRGLHAFKRLQFLGLDNTFVDDQLMAELTALPNLNMAFIDWTLVTTEAVKRTKNQLRGALITQGPRLSQPDSQEIHQLIHPPKNSIRQKILSTSRGANGRVIVTTGWYGMASEVRGEVVHVVKEEGQWTIAERFEW